MINILDHGADPTRSSDSHAAIQTAIDAADDLGHGIVSIPPGDYLVRDTIKVPGGVTLVGEGSKGNGFRTRLYCDQEIDALISLYESHTAGLCGLYLDGNYRVMRIVQATNTWGLKVDNCYIRKPRQDGNGAGLWGGALLYPDIVDTVFGSHYRARGIDIVEANYPDVGYYGANVGTIKRCQIHCRMSSIKFSGQIVIAENSIEGTLHEDFAVIELGDYSTGHVTIQDNYFEIRSGDGHQLRGVGCVSPTGGIRMFNNIMFGEASAPDSIAVDIDHYAYPLIVRDNSFIRWNTGIRAKGPSRRAVILGPNNFSHVTNEYDETTGYAPGKSQKSYQNLRYQIIGIGGSRNPDPFVGMADGGMCEVHAWTEHVRPQDTELNLQSGRNFTINMADNPAMTHVNAVSGMEFVVHFKQPAVFGGEQFCEGNLVRYLIDIDGVVKRV